MSDIKKGDKIQSQWGVLTLNEDKGKGDFVSVTTESGDYKLIHFEELKSNQPSFAEEEQAVIDIAMDAENRLENDETVQLKVGQFVKFVRHYCAIKDQIERHIEVDRRNGNAFIDEAGKAEKLLKGETTI